MEEQVARFVARGEKEALPPPADEVGFTGRLRKSLFATPLDAVLTIVFAVVSVWIIWGILDWAVFTAVFEGTDRTACLAPEGGRVGACWAFVQARLSQFTYGLYPLNERWRVDIVFALFAALLIPMALPKAPFKRLNAILLLVVFPLVSFVLLTGGRLNLAPGGVAFLFLAAAGIALFLASGRSATVRRNWAMKAAPWVVFISALMWMTHNIFGATRADLFGMRLTTLTVGSVLLSVLAILMATFAVYRTAENKSGAALLLVPLAGAIGVVVALSANFGVSYVPTNLWGGLLITLVVAVVGITASLPLGILLALGRQSRMPAVRLLCVVFIEFWRGVPLITVLFMANFMLPLFLPSGMSFNQLLRVLVGVSLFAAAYMAEVIRGGLQAIPRGQYEGADAMALTYWQKMRMIILPQALTLVIPGIVNTFIGLFKDTSLVYIIGLADLLGTVRRGFSDPTWITPSTPATGLIFAGFIFWLFCFGMSRYSISMERRLSRGHKH
ncbi:amino acid ABC transporter permease [Aureimonas mangrovi]|uniref:amino acid ABC transporter permease n=1 Tax=Aureimonas mangrovi TaxID=2758041 RepID=UPI00163D7B9E|nr:amino acid ABC transporter permease [Aureimonas mangrovi]